MARESGQAGQDEQNLNSKFLVPPLKGALKEAFKKPYWAPGPGTRNRTPAPGPRDQDQDQDQDQDTEPGQRHRRTGTRNRTQGPGPHTGPGTQRENTRGTRNPGGNQGTRGDTQGSPRRSAGTFGRHNGDNEETRGHKAHPRGKKFYLHCNGDSGAPRGRPPEPQLGRARRPQSVPRQPKGVEQSPQGLQINPDGELKPTGAAGSQEEQKQQQRTQRPPRHLRCNTPARKLVEGTTTKEGCSRAADQR